MTHMHTPRAIIDHRLADEESTGIDAAAARVVSWLEREPWRSWHSPALVAWGRALGWPVGSPWWRAVLRQARAAIQSATQESAGEAAARLILSAETAREQAMAAGDLKTALIAVKIQADILLTKRVEVLLAEEGNEHDALPTLPHLRTLGAETLRARVAMLANSRRMREAAEKAYTAAEPVDPVADFFA
jgi:hypothetical protein